MVLRKTSDQYLAICKVSTRSIKMVKRYRLIKNLNLKCDADIHVHVNVNGDDQGNYNSSMHFVQASKKHVIKDPISGP